jgi:hypothetical protein
MGNLWVAGDQDVTNTSRWVEVAPVRNPTAGNFTFTYPNGSGGQLNFRTIPGLGGPPVVVSTTLNGTLLAPLDHGRVVFSTSIDTTSFTPDKVALTAPGGSAVNITGVAAVGGTDDTQFDITFDPQSTLGGAYTLVIGPGIQDTLGHPMDAPYVGQFTLTTSSSLVVNGDFETGDFTGWTQGGDESYTAVNSDLPHGGRYSAELGPLTEGTLAQAIPTTPGALYTLDYWLQNEGGTPNAFRALIDGADVTGSVLTNAGAFAYTEYTFTFTAAGDTTELEFAFVQVPNYWHLDDVSVNPGPGPSGGSTGHQALVSVTLSAAHAPAAGVRVPLDRAAESSGSRLPPEGGDAQAALSRAPWGALSGSGLPAPLSVVYSARRPGAAGRPEPRGTEALDGFFTRLGKDPMEA